jgi:hypothetical protein
LLMDKNMDPQIWTSGRDATWDPWYKILSILLGHLALSLSKV